MGIYFVSDKGLGRFSRGQFLDWFSVCFFYALYQKEGDQKSQDEAYHWMQRKGNRKFRAMLKKPH